MKTINKLLVFGLALLIMSCATFNVSYDYDRSVDFANFKTYKWITENMPDDALNQNPFLKKAVISAVDNQLQAKGYKKQESGDTDFSVAVHGRVQQKTQVTNWSNYGGYNPWWGPYGGNIDVSTYDEGTLVIDIIDVKNKELAWRGLCIGIVDGYKNDEKGQAMVNENITDVMANFPPPAGQGK